MNIIKKEFYMSATKNKSTITVMLPDDYHQKETHYPVLYFYNGANLYDNKHFDCKTARSVHEVHKKLKEKKLLTKDVIIVSMPTPDLTMLKASMDISKAFMESMLKIQIGGLSDVYANFLVRSVKPYLKENFRILDHEDDTFIAGNEIGAVIAMRVALKFPKQFKSIGLFSLVSWFDEDAFLDFVKYASFMPNSRCFLFVDQFEYSARGHAQLNKNQLSNNRNLKMVLDKLFIKDVFYFETNHKGNTYPCEKMLTHYLLWLLDT